MQAEIKMWLCASLVGMLLAIARYGFSLEHGFSVLANATCLLTNLSAMASCLLSNDAQPCCECGVLVQGAGGGHFVCTDLDAVLLKSVPADLPAASNITAM